MKIEEKRLIALLRVVRDELREVLQIVRLLQALEAQRTKEESR